MAKESGTSIPTRKPNRMIVDQHRQRIYDVVNNLTDEELEKISEMLKQTDDAFKQETAVEPEEDETVMEAKLEPQSVEEVKGAEPDSLSRASKTTKNTLISSLQSQLEEERVARQKLESELQSLRKISLEIQDQLKNVNVVSAVKKWKTNERRWSEDLIKQTKEFKQTHLQAWFNCQLKLARTKKMKKCSDSSS